MSKLSRVKADFPILNVPGRELVYLDSAATSQKPRCVLDAMQTYYETVNANVHRGVYGIAAEATEQFEQTRRKVARFIDANSEREIVYTKNATEALNLVAYSWGRKNLKAGDAIVLTQMEHHSNIVPWQMLAAERDVEIRWLKLGDDGHLDLSSLERQLDGAKLLAVSAMSNVLGTLNPIPLLRDAAHRAGALILIDACQYVPHLPSSVAELDVDFLAFSGHKMCGPTGIGVLWAREALLEEMPPFLGGGEMINQVSMDGFTTADLPHKFEAGTPPIAEVIGLGAAVDYLSELGMDNVRQHEVELTAYAMRSLGERFGDRLTIHGPSEPAERGGVLSFAFEDIHPHDISQVLDQSGVCVRAGHHCAKPLMKALGVGATARASLYIYNDESDVDALGDALEATSKWFTY
ncbi:MAG: cysteine desulfurase [Acidimicrobiales bacterium]